MVINLEKPKLVLFSCCAITAILGVEFSGFQLALLRSVNELGFDSGMMGLPVTAQFIALCIMPLIFGPLSDRIGKKIIITIFMIIFILGCIITWLSESVFDYLIGVCVIGAGYAVCECSTTAVISDVFPENEERYINLIGSFYCIGAVSGPLVLQWLMNSFSASWRMIFLISAIAMAALLPVLLLSHITPRIKTEHKNDQNEKKRKLGHPVLLFGFILCMFFYIGIESCLGFFADTVLSVELSSPALGAYAISFFWGAMGIGRFFFGRMKNIPRNATAYSLFVVAAITVIITLVKHEYVMLAIFALAGLACSCVWPGIINAAFALNRGATGTLMSLVYLGAGLGGVVFPLMNGIIMNAASMSVSFLILAILPIIAGFYMWKNAGKVLDA
jgi:MFS family permease